MKWPISGQKRAAKTQSRLHRHRLENSDEEKHMMILGDAIKPLDLISVLLRCTSIIYIETRL